MHVLLFLSGAWSLRKYMRSVLASDNDIMPVKLSRHGRSDYNSTVMHKTFECDVPCQMDQSWNGEPIQGIIYALGMGHLDEIPFRMECCGSDSDRLRTNRTLAVADSTFSSDVHVTTWRIEEGMPKLYDAQPVDFATATKKLLWIASNCNSNNDREGLVWKLENRSMLDSEGPCLHNHDAEDSLESRGHVNKTSEMRKYLFYAAFENTNSPDYITEKTFDALQAGVVPVIYGPPNLPSLLPRDWYIWVEDYNTTDALVEHLQKVSTNETLYMQYQNARMDRDNWPKWFVDKWTFTGAAECRLCRLIVGKRDIRYEFNYTSQELMVNKTHMNIARSARETGL